ncbi:3-hydroxyacyl-CoA dehydrogenase NAD-binding domain-containing protein [Natrinema sp. 1APR25-10V2]|uniref:3-hydroxyacyl-CoA dehydrogenase n=1 Tax=Natrinema sp. 1APR25-10V2 TaxID=2951081 RepID=UPI002876A3CC|nr:3-hydroxyacyl-CoA dehydrogenase NAD-binding domain-containing protein [Natrinema sp. 1APR25-10V2]MDS0474410.1 3-hydroxyacyl-CoA dehydrogenase [Natrinema sp. 1APR25-10V2]
MVVDIDDIETVAVIGSGQMGRGIAAVAALAGYEAFVNDIDETQLEEAEERIEWSYEKSVENGAATEAEVEDALERLSFTTDLEEAVGDADFVTEAAVEQQSVKEDIFEDLDEAAPEDALLATNTSGLNITRLAETTDRPEQVVGTHWFNPPMLMELVEVIMTEHTPDGVADTAEALIESFDKTPIRCKMDIPSFIVNRLMRPYGEGPAWMAYRGEHSFEEIDSAMKYKEGFPMGPFELADFTGGIQLRVEGEQDHLEDDRPMAYDTEVCPLVHQLYDKGRYGRKADAGYYEYDERDEPQISVDAGQGFDTLLVWAPIVNEAAKMVENDVASVEDVDTGARLGGNWPVGPLEKADEVGADVILEKLTEVASRHEDTNKLAETLPCDLLVEKAKTGETFY